MHASKRVGAGGLGERGVNHIEFPCVSQTGTRHISEHVLYWVRPPGYIEFLIEEQFRHSNTFCANLRKHR